MKGLVLCGGLSSRMGADKGLILKQETTWAQRAFQQLVPFAKSVFVSIQANQLLTYQSYFSKENLVLDAPLAVKGPLTGLLSAHQQYANDDWMVLACDMINMDSLVLNILFNHYIESDRLHNIVFKEADQHHPLCGIYTANNLRHLMSLTLKNELNKFSMHYALSVCDTMEIPIESAWSSQFLNVNSPDELSNA